jgi:hypothetical protein
MTRIVTATLVVDFRDTVSGNADDPGTLQLVIDDRPDGLNGGRTSGFYLGQPVGYLLYKSAGLAIKRHVATDGSIGPRGSSTRIITDEPITFSNSDSATLSYPVSTGFSLAWRGSRFDADGNSKAINYTLSDDQKTIKLSEPAYGLARVSYVTAFDIYRLASVPTSVDQVMILAIGKEA